MPNIKELDIVYMNIAGEVSQLSKCSRKKVGAIIVKDNNILWHNQPDCLWPKSIFWFWDTFHLKYRRIGGFIEFMSGIGILLRTQSLESDKACKKWGCLAWTDKHYQINIIEDWVRQSQIFWVSFFDRWKAAIATLICYR